MICSISTTVKNIPITRWIIVRRINTKASYRPLATALVDVMAPSEYEQQPSLPRVVFREMHSNYATALSDVMAPSKFEQQPSLPRVVFREMRSNYATALSDVMAPSKFEQLRSEKRTNDWSGKLSFASPESDFTAQEKLESIEGSVPVDGIEYEPSLSYATALSDAMAPTQFEQDQSQIGKKKEWTHAISFASPESDFTACNRHEYLVRSLPLHEDEFRSSMAYSLSYATPESDFSSQILTDRMRAQLRHVEESQQLQKQQQHPTPPPQRSTLPQSYQEYIRHDFSEALVVTEARAPFRIVNVNAPWERLCGFSQDECVGDTLAILQGPETDKTKVTVLLNKLLTNYRNDGDELVTELVNYDKNRRRFTNRLTMAPLRDAETQQTTHFVGMLQDVSHRYPLSDGDIIYM